MIADYATTKHHLLHATDATIPPTRTFTRSVASIGGILPHTSIEITPTERSAGQECHLERRAGGAKFPEHW